MKSRQKQNKIWYKEYREKNQEKIKEKCKNYYEKNKEKCKQQVRENYKKHREELLKNPILLEQERKHNREYMRIKNKSSKCIICNKIIWKPAKYCRECAKTHITRLYGDKHPKWNGKNYIIRSGYKWLKINGKYIAEHIYIWKINGGEIPKNFVIHHINGDKTDNRIENLMCIHKYHHNSNHHLFENKEEKVS